MLKVSKSTLQILPGKYQVQKWSFRASKTTKKVLIFGLTSRSSKPMAARSDAALESGGRTHLAIKPIHILPANGAHECIHIDGRLRAEVDMVGMFVHIESENRSAARQCVAMVRCPLIDELAISRR